MSCLCCEHYEVIPDEGHIFSEYCVRAGYDGYCHRCLRFVCESDFCEGDA